MKVEFYVHPTDSNGEPLASSDYWVVQELDYVHCVCSNPEIAKSMLAGLKQAHHVKNALREERENEVVYRKEKETVTTKSSLAEAVIKFWHWETVSTKPIIQPVQLPESQTDPKTNPALINTSKPTSD